MNEKESLDDFALRIANELATEEGTRLLGLGFFQRFAKRLLTEHEKAERNALQGQMKTLREALQWIVRVNAMDYEYRAKAAEALAATEPK